MLNLGTFKLKTENEDVDVVYKAKENILSLYFWNMECYIKHDNVSYLQYLLNNKDSTITLVDDKLTISSNLNDDITLTLIYVTDLEKSYDYTCKSPFVYRHNKYTKFIFSVDGDDNLVITNEITKDGEQQEQTISYYNYEVRETTGEYRLTSIGFLNMLHNKIFIVELGDSGLFYVTDTNIDGFVWLIDFENYLTVDI